MTQNIAAMLLVPIAGVVVSQPGGGDVYAMVGAFIAAVCTLFNAYEMRRSAYSKATLFIGSATVGCIGPGLAIYTMEAEGWATEQTLTWHAWAGLGLIFGLSGWGALHTFLRGVSSYLERRGKTLLGQDADKRE